jgi:tetratricopeptide repeat protein 30
VEALTQFQEAQKLAGYRNEIAYYMALCHYVQKNYVQALKVISDIIEHGIKKHPELNIGTRPTNREELTPNLDAQLLQETYLIEAFNLKAAVEYQLKNGASSKFCQKHHNPSMQSKQREMLWLICHHDRNLNWIP